MSLNPKTIPVKRACLQCHNDHKKCDTTRPCARCTARGIECVEQGGKRKRKESEESLEERAAKRGVMMMSFRFDSSDDVPSGKSNRGGESKRTLKATSSNLARQKTKSATVNPPQNTAHQQPQQQHMNYMNAGFMGQGHQYAFAQAAGMPYQQSHVFSQQQSAPVPPSMDAMHGVNAAAGFQNPYSSYTQQTPPTVPPFVAPNTIPQMQYGLSRPAPFGYTNSFYSPYANTANYVFPPPSPSASASAGSMNNSSPPPSSCSSSSNGTSTNTPGASTFQHSPSPSVQNASPRASPLHQPHAAQFSQQAHSNFSNQQSSTSGSSFYSSTGMFNPPSFNMPHHDTAEQHQSLIKAMEQFKAQYLNHKNTNIFFEEPTAPSLVSSYASTTTFEDVTELDEEAARRQQQDDSDDDFNTDHLEPMYSTKNGGVLRPINSKQRILLQDPAFMKSFNDPNLAVIIMSKDMFFSIYEEPENLSKSFFCNAAYASMLQVPIEQLTAQNFSHANLGLYRWCKELQHNKQIRANHLYMYHEKASVLDFKMVLQTRGGYVHARCLLHMNYDGYCWFSFEKVDQLDDEVFVDGTRIAKARRRFDSVDEFFAYYNNAQTPDVRALTMKAKSAGKAGQT